MLTEEGRQTSQGPQNLKNDTVAISLVNLLLHISQTYDLRTQKFETPMSTDSSLPPRAPKSALPIQRPGKGQSSTTKTIRQISLYSNKHHRKNCGPIMILASKD